MAELGKIKRILARHDPDAPHERLLVIDATTGSNAVLQAKEFHRRRGLTGLIVTKLDGSGKGGVLVAIQKELGIPTRFIGTGETAGEPSSRSTPDAFSWRKSSSRTRPFPSSRHDALGHAATTKLQKIDLWLGVPVCWLFTMVRSQGDGQPAPAAGPPTGKILFIKLAEQGSTVLAQARSAGRWRWWGAKTCSSSCSPRTASSSTCST